DFRSRRNERSRRGRRTLIGIRRPKMEWRRRNFECEANQGQDDPGGEKRRHGSELRRDAGKISRACHSINEADPKKRERARSTAEEKIFQAGFGGTHVGLVESSHDVKRQTGEFEPYEDDEQFFAADE